ncbi:MAG: hypothetical protein NVSMB65_14040 [Chloroflexota bacterium]
MTVEVKVKKKRSRKGLVAGLVVGGVVGATAIIMFAPRSGASGQGQGAGIVSSGMNGARDLLAQAQAILGAAREQVREAVEEGKATARTTKADLTARYEALRANPDHPALPPARV